MFRIASSLKTRVRLLFLSNTNELNARVIDSDLRGITDKIIYSYRIGLLKPDPRIYRIALKTACTEPQKTLFVDDRLENVEGARKLGIIAHQFKDAEDLLELLQSHDI
jgi:HAD superfamily hydrolase (TIGR01509 family)